jgi:hypothetical protein
MKQRVIGLTHFEYPIPRDVYRVAALPEIAETFQRCPPGCRGRPARVWMTVERDVQARCQPRHG